MGLTDILGNFVYLVLYKMINRIESTTGYSDLACLFLLARDGKGEGAIVEIGSYKGKSAVVMALGSKAGRREAVNSVDPHLEGTKDIFMKNVKAFGVEDYVKAIVATSFAGRKLFDSKIRLLFIDGCHEYEFIKNDILLWKDLMIDGGVIVFHDINWKTVARAIDELIKPSGDFIIEGTTGCSLIVSKKFTANKKIFDEIELFNKIKDFIRPWRNPAPIVI